MDVRAIAEEIYSYTSGYPFLVTKICQCIDEELGKDWTPRLTYKMQGYRSQGV